MTTRRILASSIVTLAVSLTMLLASEPIPVADAIIARGKVYTGNVEQP
jgi:hypothetical protein